MAWKIAGAAGLAAALYWLFRSPTREESVAQLNRKIANNPVVRDAIINATLGQPLSLAFGPPAPTPPASQH